LIHVLIFSYLINLFHTVLCTLMMLASSFRGPNLFIFQKEVLAQILFWHSQLQIYFLHR
jgi:hypothetical protein